MLTASSIKNTRESYRTIMNGIKIFPKKKYRFHFWEGSSWSSEMPQLLFNYSEKGKQNTKSKE